MKNKVLAITFFVITLAIFLTVERQLKLMTDINSILDMRIFYNEASVLNLFNSLGKSGRKMYRFLHVVDFLFIISFCFMQIVLANDKLAKININIMTEKWLFFIPAIARGITDFGENIVIDVMLLNYPFISSHSVKMAYTLTFLKWVFLVLVIAELLSLTVLEKRGFMKESLI